MDARLAKSLPDTVNLLGVTKILLDQTNSEQYMLKGVSKGKSVVVLKDRGNAFGLGFYNGRVGFFNILGSDFKSEAALVAEGDTAVDSPIKLKKRREKTARKLRLNRSMDASRGIFAGATRDVQPYDAVVTRDHHPSSTTELPVTVGASVRVLSTFQAWVFASCAGNEGIFPFVCISPLAADDANPALDAPSRETITAKWRDKVNSPHTLLQTKATFVQTVGTLFQVMHLERSHRQKALALITEGGVGFPGRLDDSSIHQLQMCIEDLERVIQREQAIRNVVKIQAAVRSFVVRRRVRHIEPWHIDRMRIFSELLRTEQDYVKNLGVLVDHWVEPLIALANHGKKSVVLTLEEIESLFGNVAAIYRFHLVFLSSIKKAVDKLPLGGAGAIGELFRSSSNHLKMYGEYMSNFHASRRVLNSLQTRPSFQKFWEDTNAAHNDMPLLSLLAAPLSRIPYYRLVVQRCLDLGDASMEESHSLFSAISNFIESSLDAQTNRAEISKLQKRIAVPKGYALTPPERVFVKQDEFLVRDVTGDEKAIDGALLLFEDIAVTAAKRKDDSLKVLHTALLENARIEEEPDGFTLVSGDTQLAFTTTDNAVIVNWVRILNLTISKRQKNRVFGVTVDSLLKRELSERKVITMRTREAPAPLTLEEENIPLFVRTIVAELSRDERLCTVGLLRIAGDARQIEALKLEIDKGSSSVDFASVATHDLAGLLRLFFQSTPEPLLGFENYERWLQGYSRGEKQFLLEAVTMLNKLPKCNLMVLSHLISFCERVAAKAHINKMNLKNLATVFAPSLLRPQRETIEYTLNVTKICELSFMLFRNAGRLLPGHDAAASASGWFKGDTLRGSNDRKLSPRRTTNEAPMFLARRTPPRTPRELDTRGEPSDEEEESSSGGD